MNKQLSRTEDLAPVLTAASMREADRISIEDIGIPGFTLMESAGRETALIAHELISELSDPSVLVVCGKGNNGGDGFVVARYLAQDGIRVSVLLTTTKDAYTGDARKNLEILNTLIERDLAGALTIEDVSSSAGGLQSADLIVDALLGTGLSSEVREPLASLIASINDSEAAVLSVDIASGLNADSGEVMGNAVLADVTATMGAAKTGLLVNSGPDVSGIVQVVDIGIPAGVLASQAALSGCGFLSDDDYVRERLRPRTRSDHKYSTGPALVVGGSEAFPGAPALAARGAARAGSGYIVCCCPEGIRSLLLEKLDEIPVEGWTGGDTGIQTLVGHLGTRWEKAKAMLIGPGMGREDGIRDVVRNFLTRFDGPVVIDADGLYALGSDQQWVAERSRGNWIFTPHEGEFRRLSGSESASDINRLEAARRFAAEWNVVLLLKGQPSITAAPDGSVMVNRTGNPSVGTAGSGDVLAGVVTGLLAQGLTSFDAAVCGIHIAGTAADDAVQEGASQSLVASDILNSLPGTLLRYS